jgi:hypothetical protein
MNTAKTNYSEPVDAVTRALSSLRKLYIRYSFKNKAPPIPSGTLVAYEILPIGVSERHHVVKARILCGSLVAVELQRFRSIKMRYFYVVSCLRIWMLMAIIIFGFRSGRVVRQAAFYLLVS